MARMAVGAVNMEEALCSDSTRKNAPGSGVPTGLPCKHTVQQQLINCNMHDDVYDKLPIE